ncbi:hypothetical protein P9112_007222 [Eukaryota sp. TZLM1-RC]
MSTLSELRALASTQKIVDDRIAKLHTTWSQIRRSCSSLDEAFDSACLEMDSFLKDIDSFHDSMDQQWNQFCGQTLEFVAEGHAHLVEQISHLESTK